MTAILLIQHNDTNLYVIAKPINRIENVMHVDQATQTNINPKEISYHLIKLQNGRPTTSLGFVSAIEPGVYFLRIFTSSTTNACIYKSESLVVLEKVYIL